MQVIKRDGTVLDYDRAKIAVAIGKANAEMEEKERASGEEIESILSYIEGKKKKRMLVEDIQDIIEEKLMEQGHYELAKTYIIYRYNRALVRKANTTDEAILSLISNSNKDVMEENSNKNALAAATQRDLIAGEVSKDLTRRILLRFAHYCRKYDNPPALHFRGTEPISWTRDKTELQREGAFKKEVISHSAFELEIGDRLIVFSDGVTQSGLGKGLPLGWRLDGVRKFVVDEIGKDPDISSRDLSRAIVQKAYSLDGLSSKDDITCSVVYVRRPRRLLIVTGPPFLKESDAVLGQKIREFDGKKIVSGGTTAQIVSRVFGAKLRSIGENDSL